MSEIINNIENEEIAENNGVVKISDDVISTITVATLLKVPGVHSMSGSLASGIVEFLGVKKTGSKGIKVVTDESGNISLEIHVTVQYGFKIPDVAWEIQEKVKEEVEAVTGLTVVKVNVHVDGINIEKETPVSEEAVEVSEETSEE